MGRDEGGMCPPGRPGWAYPRSWPGCTPLCAGALLRGAPALAWLWPPLLPETTSALRALRNEELLRKPSPRELLCEPDTVARGEEELLLLTDELELRPSLRLPNVAVLRLGLELERLTLLLDERLLLMEL